MVAAPPQPTTSFRTAKALVSDPQLFFGLEHLVAQNIKWIRQHSACYSRCH
jgi:hypothetical protein